MEFKTSIKTASISKRPHIKRGYYSGQLLEVKPREKEDGTAIIGKFGKQVILKWAVYDEKGQEAVMVNGAEEGKPEAMTPLLMYQVVYSEYTDEKNPGQFQTAFTPNSAITKIFKALGWGGPDGEKFEVDDYYGKLAILNINDWKVETKDADKNRTPDKDYVASSILKDGVSKFDGEQPSPSVPAEKVAEKKKDIVKDNPSIDNDVKAETIEEDPLAWKKINEGIDTKINVLNLQHKNGEITDKGFAMAKESLENSRPK